MFITVHNNKHFKNLISFILFSVACCGGDGTVNKLATALLNRVHALKKVDMKPGFNPIKSNLPLGIIPTG